jgi:hypothetical protein
MHVCTYLYTNRYARGKEKRYGKKKKNPYWKNDSQTWRATLVDRFNFSRADCLQQCVTTGCARVVQGLWYRTRSAGNNVISIGSFRLSKTIYYKQTVSSIYTHVLYIRVRLCYIVRWTFRLCAAVVVVVGFTASRCAQQFFSVPRAIAYKTSSLLSESRVPYLSILPCSPSTKLVSSRSAVVVLVLLLLCCSRRHENYNFFFSPTLPEPRPPPSRLRVVTVRRPLGLTTVVLSSTENKNREIKSCGTAAAAGAATTARGEKKKNCR